MKATRLESERLVLIPLSTQHLSQDYVNWLNDPEVTRYMESGGDYTLDKLKIFLSGVEKNEILFWGIHIKDSMKHIGNIKMDPVSFKHGTCEYGIMMGDKSEWGKGYAKEASLIVIDHCFKELGLRKITLGVTLDNEAAVHLYKKMNFKTEGIYKKHDFYNGKYCDVLRMAIFNPNFKYEL